jgi:adenosine deaminase
VRLITDISGESAEQSGPFTLALLEEEANPLIVALGLGGPEEGLPRSQFAKLFEQARKAGYHTVAHAGETGGSDHVRQAVDDPPFFGTDLAREWRRARDELGLSLRELWELNLNGLRYGLAETGVRRRLMGEFHAAAAALVPAWA